MAIDIFQARQRNTAAKDQTEEAKDRLSTWKRKLLDLTLANKLLNFKETKSSIELECPDLSQLEDRLSDGKKFKLLPRTEVLSGKDERKIKGGDFTRKWGCPGFGSILEWFIPTLRAVTWLELNVMAQPIIGKRRLAIGTVCGKVSWSNWAGGFEEFGAPNGGMTRKKPAKNFINV